MSDLELAHRIAVLSDTHGLLRPEVEEILKTCEVIMHGGDIGRMEVADRLRSICPMYAVRGNVDKEWAEGIPRELEVQLFGFRFYMVHNKKHIRKGLEDVDIVIYGHSHKYGVKRDGNCSYLNPGSCGPRRFRQPVTMMALTLYPAAHRFETEEINCLPETLQGDGIFKMPESEMDKLIRKIMKGADSGISADDIADRNGVDRELAEQICRIYLTHPGVDVDGIMARMELRNMF